MNILKIRVVLDSDEEVFRDFELADSGNLEDLHETILAAFNQGNDQMASFYLSDDNWNKGEELVLMDTGEGARLMKEEPLINHEAKGSKLLYVYDFLNLKIFYVEVLERSESLPGREYPFLLMALGELPSGDDALSLEGLMAGIETEDSEDYRKPSIDYDEEEEGEWRDEEEGFENLDDYEGLL